MTEAEWLACTDPTPMLEFLRGKASDRKLRLLAVACHRRIWRLLNDQADSRKTLEFAERFADGLATKNELHGRSWGMPGSAFSVVLYKAWEAAENSLQFGAGTVKEDVLRMDPEKHKIWENAFQAAWENNSLGEAMRIADTAMPGEWVAKGRLAWTKEQAGQCQMIREVFGSMGFRTVRLDPSWLTAEAKNMAKAVYDECRFSDLSILADALAEAGCTNTDILNHCLQPDLHVRGCWVVDLVLGQQ
jgi:hypothetical protein